MVTYLTFFSKKRKTISLSVTRDGTVKVHAPYGTSLEYIREFVQKNEAWIIKSKEKIKARNEKYEGLETEDIKLLKHAAECYIPLRVESYAKKMGVKPSDVKITTAKTRFGSCSAKNSLCFSCYLALYETKAIDYVIVHELAHIIEKNHSKRFYAVVEKYMPDYKDRIKMLKK